MITEALHAGASSSSATLIPSSAHRTAASYESELSHHRRIETDLRAALTLETDNLREKDELLQHQTAIGEETVHRLLNGLQMVASLLSLQSRASDDAHIASQFAEAARRVAMVSRIHRLLQSLEGRATIAFRPCLEELCRDYREMLSSPEHPRDIVIEGAGFEVSTKAAVPLALIANELITNAAKHGRSRIAVKLEHRADGRRALSVSNDGPALPADFDPAASRGLGMKLIQTFVAEISGQLQFGPGDDGQGARFSVVFA